jgi:uncharacterized protein (DUF1330 family)
MKAYAIANVDVTNLEGFKEYAQRVGPLVEKHGGRYLVRGGAVTVKEGDPGLNRVVVIEFPSMEAANAFYDDPDYKPVLAMRLANAVSTFAFVEGYEG